jgi:hypothetical protein
MATRTEIAADTFTTATGQNLTAHGSWVNTYPSLTEIWTDATTDTIYSVYGDKAAYYYSGGTFSNDQYSEITVLDSLGAGTYKAGVIVRSSTDINANRDYYTAYLYANDNTIYIDKVVNGTQTNITSQATSAMGAGDKLSLEVEGTALRAYINSTLIVSTTDSALSSGRPGVYIQANTDKHVTAWSGGDLTASASSSLLKLPGLRSMSGGMIDLS